MEESGIPTVAVYVKAFAARAARMGVPRTVVTKHPMGRPMGAPGDHDRQAEVLEAAFTLLETASTGGAVAELEPFYRPGSVNR